MRGILRLLAIAALALGARAAYAWENEGPCDFLTGGGFIIHLGAKANFGVGGGCKNGSPTWGHLEYIDHGTGLNVHWTSITGYFIFDNTGNDPKTNQPTGARLICGSARTNLYGDVDWIVNARDRGEPGDDDWFIIRLKKNGVTVYTTEFDADHTLGGPGPGGGNIQLHKPNPSTLSGSFGGFCNAF